MPNLTSVAREAAEARALEHAPGVDRGLVGDVVVNDHRHDLRTAYVAGFTECASRLPSEDELEEAINRLDWGYMVDGPTVGEIARAVSALIGEKISG